MSAPDTNIERQKNRHKTMGWGIWLGLGFAAIVAIGLAAAVSVFGVDLTSGAPAVNGSAAG